MSIRIDGTNTTANPGITGGDADTGLQFGTDEVSIVTGGTDRVTVDSSGNVGIGTTSPSQLLHLSSTGFPTIRVTDADNSTYFDLVNSDGDIILKADEGNTFSNSAIRFMVDSSEKFRCDSSGRLLVGTSSQSKDSTLVLEGSSLSGSNNESGLWMQRGTSSPADGGALGRIEFSDNTGDPSAEIRAFRDGGTWSASSKPGRLVFSTTADGASSPTERMRISNDGAIRAQKVYDFTIATGANVHVDSGGLIRRAVSSAKYKTDVETLEDSYADALLECRPVWYRSTCQGDNPDFGWWGFIAEEVAAIDPRLVQYKTTEAVVQEDGSLEHVPCDPEPEGVSYDRFVPHLLNLIKRQNARIEALEAEVTALKGGAS